MILGMDDPWGLEDAATPHPVPPEPLPPRLAKLAALSGPEVVTDWSDWESPGPQALPEVATLLAQGWALLEQDPRFVLMPAIWPTVLRCWLPDRMPKTYSSFDGQTSRIIPAGQLCHPEHHQSRAPEAFEAELAAEVGLPAPLPGRIWLLRSPWPTIGLKMVLDLFARRCDEQGRYEAADVIEAAREMLRWDEAHILAWWTGEERDAASAWQAQGRIGEDVVELVHAGIGPDLWARMPGLSVEQAAAWRWAVAGRTAQEAVDRVVFFRSAGLPDTPPADLYRLAAMSESDVLAWFGGGFDVPAMVQLMGLTLGEAITWRDLGYSPARTQELLQVDPSLTAAEADTFTQAGIVGAHQMDWIQHGFTSSEAAAYDENDVQPNEARVWQSMGLRPGDVRPGQHLPAGYQRGGWAMPAGMRMRDAQHSVQDPPGTRGVIAERDGQHRHRHRRR